MSEDSRDSRMRNGKLAKAPSKASSTYMSASSQTGHNAEPIKSLSKISSFNRRNIVNLDNAPMIPSRFDDRYHALVIANPTLLGNRVHIPWYRRFADVLPEKEQINYQPFREIQNRDEDIALQHMFGTHECMVDLVHKGQCKLPANDCKRIRDVAMARYTRIKKREEEKKNKQGPPPEESAFFNPGQEIDFATEFGFSENKRNIVNPVVNFLVKLQTNRERKLVRRSLELNSKWRLFQRPHIWARVREEIIYMKRRKAHARLRRMFNLVRCVDRFIKCVAMIAGDTQTLLKDKTHPIKAHAGTIVTETGSEREIAFFNVQNYKKVGQVQIPFHIQLILSKPWFCRTNKDIEMAVNYLEKMRCFSAFPRPFQYVLARVAWYIEVPTQKVIIRQCQEAVNFYLLLNGSVRIDKLEGSPCEEEEGRFNMLRRLSSQDMFGDECITNPFSERTYTATSEERCAMLDFNMHDYNNMIQTANTTEEAPDHIRFLCKLRIMDSFPKINLLQEQDTNVTYFFFRPGTVVCKSVRDSPFVFVIRNGSCSLLLELKPKVDPRKQARLTRHSVSSNNTSQDSLEKSVSKSRSLNVFDKLTNKLTDEDKKWFESTKIAFEKSKAGMKGLGKEMQDKTERLTRQMSVEALEKFNLVPTNMNTQTSQTSKLGVDSGESQLTRKNSQSLRWNLEGRSEDNSYTALGLSNSEDIGRKRSKIVGTNMELSPETIVARASTSMYISDHNNSSQAWQAQRAPPKKTRLLPPIKKKKPAKPLPIPDLPARTYRTHGFNRASTLSRLTDDVGQLDESFLLEFNKQVTKPPKTQVKAEEMIYLKETKRSKTHVRPEENLPLDRYSQWTRRALLTVTDVVGNEWLDYNDGTYKEPTEDLSLVSHGATIIMIKKEFMLKYMRKVW